MNIFRGKSKFTLEGVGHWVIRNLRETINWRQLS